tara:strand:+ start:86 stop:775 length:690 start_codon:yes stop_codon:yes gene_type:complete
MAQLREHPLSLDGILGLMFFRSMSIPSSTPQMNICVYCGSQPGRNPAYREAARILGQMMAASGIGLVYGGGTRGIMGTVADAVMSNGGKVTGIIPEFLMDKEATRHSLGQLDELVVTADMHERKHLMFDRSDAFVALPGGIGTLEEIIEIMTWAQLGRHTKPIVLADVGNFWKPLESLIDHMKDQGFIHTAHLVQPLVISDPAQIVPAVQNLLAQAAPQDGDSAVIENL